MRSIVLFILWVTVPILTFQSIVSAKNMKDSVSLKSTRNKLATIIGPKAVAEVIRRKNEMRMNILAGTRHIKSKKFDKLLDNVSKIVDIYKTLITTALSFVDPILDTKKYGLSVINTIITVLKFLMNLKNSKNKENMGAREVGNTTIDDRIGMPHSSVYRPT